MSNRLKNSRRGPTSVDEIMGSILGRCRMGAGSLIESASAMMSEDLPVQSRSKSRKKVMIESDAASDPEPEPQADPLLQLVSLQKASGCWELKAALAAVFGKKEDEVTNHRPAQVDGSVWATVLALIWLHTCRSGDQVEWQFVAMKAASWIRSQKPHGLTQCVCDGNVLLGGHVTQEALGI